MKKLIHFEPKLKKERGTDINVRYAENGDRIITISEAGRTTEMVNPRALTINDLRGTIMLGWEDKACHIQVRQFKGSKAEMLMRMMFCRSNEETETDMAAEVMLNRTAQPIGA